MKKSFAVYFILWLLCSLSCTLLNGQASIIADLSGIDTLSPGRHHRWISLGTTTYGLPQLAPIIILKGKLPGKILGLTAAIHGNELNGIPVIHRLADTIDTDKLAGSIVAIPGLNAPSVQLDQRRFPDGEDLNRLFPGKANGSSSQQFVQQVSSRLLPALDVLLDLHTASFGRTNTLYARADVDNDTLMALARLQEPDIILASKGSPSAGASSTGRTLRAEASLRGIPCITIEYGNPQVFQAEMTQRGISGIIASMGWLGMYGPRRVAQASEETFICSRSYWLYTDQGGFLEVTVDLNERISQGQLIARLRDAFGTLTQEYYAPQDGIVIGKSSNPSGMNGARIIHLGIP